jgi:hypothetical protein
VSTRGPVVRVLIGLGLLCGAILALASSIVLHGFVLLIVVVAAGFAASVAYGVRDEGRAASVEAAWKAAAWTASVIVLVVGLGVLVGGAVAAVVSCMAVVTAGAVWLLKTHKARHETHKARHAAGGAPGPAPVMGDGDQARVLPAVPPSRSQPPVALLSTSVLGTEWLRTTAVLASRLEPVRRQAIIWRRQETLDELERRDPAGFARWLAAGAATDNDPATFVRGDRTTGSDAA